MAENGNIRLHAIVEGRVQGVNFRAYVQQNAHMSGLTGWVRNRWDGTVEVVAEGQQAELEDLVAALLRGPRASRVTNVTPEWQAGTGEFSNFRIKYTYG